MNITLTPQQDAYVRQQLDANAYDSVSELLTEALQALEARDRLRRLRESIAEAERDFEAGNYEEWTPELMARLVREGDEMYEAGIVPDPDVCP